MDTSNLNITKGFVKNKYIRWEKKKKRKKKNLHFTLTGRNDRHALYRHWQIGVDLYVYTHHGGGGGLFVLFVFHYVSTTCSTRLLTSEVSFGVVLVGWLVYVLVRLVFVLLLCFL